MKSVVSSRRCAGSPRSGLSLHVTHGSGHPGVQPFRQALGVRNGGQVGYARCAEPQLCGTLLDRFRAGADLRPWLLRIVANEARNRVRSSGRRHQLELRLTEGFRPGDAAPSPEAVAVAADERRRLLETINALSEDDRLVIASRYFLDLSGEETAAALGIPEGTVKSRLSRALARLKARVEEAASA